MLQISLDRMLPYVKTVLLDSCHSLPLSYKAIYFFPKKMNQYLDKI